MGPTCTSTRTTTRARSAVFGLTSIFAAVFAAVIGFAPAATAALSSTTVLPAGHGFTASLASGTADFTVSTTTVRCNNSTTTGTVPAAPGNHNNEGPVLVGIAAPVFDNTTSSRCPTNAPLTTATTTTNTTNGAWTITIQFDPAGSTAIMTIPQAGVVTKTEGLANCTITVAPNGPAQIRGTLANGTTGNLPTLSFSNVALPISVSNGFGCPSASTTATFSATYQIADTTDPSQMFTVTA